MTGPERIWVKPCFPCSEPDDYYVCHPQYLTAGATGYVRADIHDEVVKALRDCVDDLEAHVKAEYGHPNVNPAMQAKFDRDMEPVRAARAALARTGEG